MAAIEYSNVGLAREVAALHGLRWAAPGPDAPGRAIQGSVDTYAKVVLEEPALCPHYAAAVVVDVEQIFELLLRLVEPRLGLARRVARAMGAG